jgi:transcriptional regulator with XRE-family HTH domain
VKDSAKTRLQKTFGQRLKAFREARDLSQSRLADLCEPKRSRGMIAELESGGSWASAETIEGLAKVLHREPAEFFQSDTDFATSLQREDSEDRALFEKLIDDPQTRVSVVGGIQRDLMRHMELLSRALPLDGHPPHWVRCYETLAKLIAEWGEAWRTEQGRAKGDDKQALIDLIRNARPEEVKHLRKMFGRAIGEASPSVEIRKRGV